MTSEKNVAETTTRSPSPPPLEAPPGDDERVQVTCGSLVGDMIRRLFICPGLHQPCIEMENGDMVTPKRFSVMGQKERLKDWKNAIRINGVSFRKLMDTGQLEFYAHDNLCTGRCVSRNSGWSKYDVKIENLNRTMLSATTLDNDLPTFAPALANTLNEHAYTVLRHAQGLSPTPATRSLSTSPLAVQPSTSVSHCDATPGGDITVKEEPQSEDDDDDSGGCHGDNDMSSLGILCRAASELPSGISIVDDSENFWRGIINIGLLDDFVREMKHSLDMLKNEVSRSSSSIDSQDAGKLSRIAMELGLTTKLQWKLSEHTNAIRKQDEKLMMEIESLKRKVAESEQKRKELKRKTDCFTHFMQGHKEKRVDLPNSTTGPNS